MSQVERMRWLLKVNGEMIEVMSVSEHEELREALITLMAAARPYLEFHGSYANLAMAKARAALGDSSGQGNVQPRRRYGPNLGT